MTIYTSVISNGNHEDQIWDVAGFPNGANDLAIISPDHNITLSAGVTVECAVQLMAGTTETVYTNNGSLNLAGDFEMADKTHFKVGPNSVTDTFEYFVRGAQNSKYTFIGSAGNRFILKSTGLLGGFTDIQNNMVPDFRYGIVEEMAEAEFGRTHNSTEKFVHFERVKFTDCANLQLDELNAQTDAGFLLSHCDFITNVAINSFNDFPGVRQTGVKGSRQRLIEFCTFSGKGTGYGAYYIRANGTIYEHCVIDNFQMTASTHNDISFRNSFLSNRNLMNNSLTADTAYVDEFIDCAFYHVEGGHPLTLAGNTDITYTGNIFEGGGIGLNWHLYGVTSALTITIKNNIYLGQGTCLTFTGIGDPILDVSNNTFIIDNQGIIGSGIAHAPCLITEQACILGVINTKEVYNNLQIDLNSGDARDQFIALVNNTPNQLTYVDYNACYRYPTVVQVPPVLYDSNLVITGGIGANDIANNPQLVDRFVGIGPWDMTLSEVGTVDHAIDEMLKLNEDTFDPAYTPFNLVAYVKAGARPQNVIYATAGRYGDSIGAVEFTNAAPIPPGPVIELTAPFTIIAT